MVHLFDSHCHLQDTQLQPYLHDIMKRAVSCDVSQIMCCGTRPKDWDNVQEIVQYYPTTVIPSFGIHPWYVDKLQANWLEDLKTHLLAGPSGIGEIGLDFALKSFNKNLQEEVFIKQLLLAQSLKRPVSIHCRKAWGRMIDILTEVDCGLTGLFHSYSGGAELVSHLAKNGWYFSFSGTITRTGNKKGRKALLAVPDNQLLIETDSPDLLPVHPLFPENTFNEPANLKMVVDAVAEIKSLSREEISLLTKKNFERLFL
ncbi:MAG: TatD family hydrolase [Fibrobacteria bacterium]|nr:TatD family hydrolase [Fibrobacteria bacterium]